MKHSHLKKTRKSGGKAVKHLALLLALTVVLCAATVGTVAYFTAQASSDSTGITIGQVACSVSDPVNGTYTITNTGNVEAYIRVAVVANTVENGVIVGNATANVTNTNDWTLNGDFYYYNGLLGAKSSATLTVTADSGAQVSVLAEALQPGAADAAWGYVPSSN